MCRGGKAVLGPVVGRPPKHALLGRRHGHEGGPEMKDAAGLKRAVRKIAVIARRDEEHAHHQQRRARNQVIPVKRNEKDQQRCEMNERKRQGVKNGNSRAIRERDSQIPGNRSHPANSSASTSDAFRGIFPRAQEILPELRATNDHIAVYGCLEKRVKRNEVQVGDARKDRSVMKCFRGAASFVARVLKSLPGITSSEYAIVPVRSKCEER